MKILLDTNVLLDVALERQPYFSDSETVLSLAENRRFEGFISASTFSDLYYIVRKQKGRALTLEFIENMTQICQIAIVDRTVISHALTLGFPDFEDAIQCATAIENQLDGIVTRDTQDFAQATIQIFTPITLIQSIA